MPLNNLFSALGLNAKGGLSSPDFSDWALKTCWDLLGVHSSLRHCHLNASSAGMYIHIYVRVYTYEYVCVYMYAYISPV